MRAGFSSRATAIVDQFKKNGISVARTYFVCAISSKRALASNSSNCSSPMAVKRNKSINKSKGASHQRIDVLRVTVWGGEGEGNMRGSFQCGNVSMKPIETDRVSRKTRDFEKYILKLNFQ